MKKIMISALAVAVVLTITAAANADSMSKSKDQTVSEIIAKKEWKALASMNTKKFNETNAGDKDTVIGEAFAGSSMDAKVILFEGILYSVTMPKGNNPVQKSLALELKKATYMIEDGKRKALAGKVKTSISKERNHDVKKILEEINKLLSKPL